MRLPEIKKRDEFDSLVVLRGCTHLMEDALHTGLDTHETEKFL